LSTPSGSGALAIIRISGPDALTIYGALCPEQQIPKPRYATLRTLYTPHQSSSSAKDVLDPSAIVLYFPSPNSATGEDVLELHVHGGRAVVAAVLSAIPKCIEKSNKIRYAEAGEFTKRAFFNDRLDLTQVESLGDTLSAMTERQRRNAVRGSGKQLSIRYEAWREDLLKARAEIEALIDFSEDQHFDESPAELISNVSKKINALHELMKQHVENAVKGELLRDGIVISLLGAPNAGKSSLLNKIVGREAAIVSHEAGTTRDVIEVSLDIGGYLCRFADTAGLRKALQLDNDEHEPDVGIVEQEGIKRAKAQALASDLVIIVLSFEKEASMSASEDARLMINQEVFDTAKQVVEGGGNIVVVVNKYDQKPASMSDDKVKRIITTALPQLKDDSITFTICTSSEHSDGKAATSIARFTGLLCSKFNDMTSVNSSVAHEDISYWQESLGATERQRRLSEECINQLEAFMDLASTKNGTQDSSIDSGIDFVLAAEHLRNAATCLARITGKGEGGDIEEVLGVIFEKFCVGK